MRSINGVVTAIVTGVRPGEVKLKFPWLHESDDEERESKWVRIATAMSGNKRGTFLMPEVKDEVLVAFEKGSFQHPYVIGFLWNGKDKPPETDTKKRTIKTKSGNMIQLDDNPGQEKITIKTKGGQTIEMKDTPMGSITIKTKMGNEIAIDDSGGGAITLRALREVSLQAPQIGLTTTNLSISSPTFSHSSGVTTFTGPVNIVGATTVTGAVTITGVTAITGTTTIIGVSALPPLAGSKLAIT